MRYLEFNVNSQTLKRLDSFKPAAGSVDYLTASFTFSEDWSGTTKTAKCRVENEIYSAVINSSGVCKIPHEALAQDETKRAFGVQEFYISVEGVQGSKTITTEEIKIELSLTGTGEAANAADPTPALYAQYIEDVTAATKENADTAAAAADSATASAASMKNDYANANKVNVSGATIRLDDVSPVEHFPRVRVHGKNLAPSNKVTYTNSGYTVTPNEDGSVTVTGAATTTSPIYLSVALKKDGSSELLTVPLKAGKKYRLSGYKDGELTTRIAARIELANGVTIFKTANYMHNYTDTTQNRELAQLYIQSTGHAVGDTSLCGTYKVQLEEGEEVTEYTPYIEPTTLTLKKFTKNIAPSLAEGKTVTSNGVTFTGKANGGISAKGTPDGISRYSLYYGAPLVRSGYITLSLSGDYSNIVPDFQLRDKDENIIKQIQTGAGATINLDNYEGIAFWDIAIKRQTDGVDVSGTVYVQLEVGGAATTYEKCTETEYTPSIDGAVEGLTSISPTMTLLTAHEGIIIDCEYNRDINEAFKNINSSEEANPEEIKAAVNEYLDKNPIKAPVTSVNGKTGDIELNAADVGAISTEELETAVDGALQQAKESGEFKGEKGDTGKSAYEYAKDGGYEGTEEEFAEKLAKEQKALTINGTSYDSSEEVTIETGDFIITVNDINVDENGIYKVDCTAVDLVTAYFNGRRLICNHDGLSLELLLVDLEEGFFMFKFSMPAYVELCTVTYDNDDIYAQIDYLDSFIWINNQVWDGDGTVDFTDTINEMIDTKLGVIENGSY